MDVRTWSFALLFPSDLILTAAVRPERCIKFCNFCFKSRGATGIYYSLESLEPQNFYFRSLFTGNLMLTMTK